MVAFHCPHCGKHFRAPDELAGQRVRCRGCRRILPIPANTAATLALPDPGGRSNGPPAETLGAPPPSGSPGGVPNVAGYEILGELGRGGMGVVYKARHLGLNRTVALKMVLAGGHAGAAELARFRSEAEAVAQLQHPNIVQIHDVGEQDGLPFFSLEYVEGGSLAQALAGKPLPPRKAAELIETVALAVQAAHGHNIVHRDLKPANVLLTPDGTPKVTDFGLAKRLDEGGGQTRTGAIMGTPSYMAPEQAAGKGKEVGPAADVHALGALLYECLTGRPPYLADAPLDTLWQVLHSEPVPPRQLQPKVPRDLETVCLKCLRKDPNKRYASALALAKDLQRFLKGEPIRARPVSAWSRCLKWARRRPAAAALLGVTTLAVLLLLGGGLWYNAELQTALGDARRQQQRAEGTLRRALEGVDRLTRVTPERMALMAKQLTDERRQQLRDALELCEGFIPEGGTNPAARRERGRAYLRLAILHLLLGELPQAEQDCRVALDTFGTLAAEFPDAPDHGDDLARAKAQFGHILLSSGRRPAAEIAYRKALQLAERAVARRPGAAARQLLAEIHRHLGILALAGGQFPEAEKSWRKDREIYEALAREHPEVANYRSMGAVVRVNLATLYLNSERLDEAEKSLREASAIVQGLQKGEPEALRDYPYLEAMCRLGLGTIGVKRRRFKDAEPQLRQAFAAYEQLSRDYPRVADYPIQVWQCYSALHDIYKEENPQALLELSTRGIPIMEAWLKQEPQNAIGSMALTAMYGTRALDGWTRLGRHKEALADWDRALRVDRGMFRHVILVGKAFTRAHQGQYAAAVKEADAVLADRAVSAEGLFMGARVYAVAADRARDQAELADGYAARSVVLLRQATQRGLMIFKDEARPESLRRDPDFAPLKARADFRELLTALEAKEKKSAR